MADFYQMWDETEAAKRASNGAQRAAGPSTAPNGYAGKALAYEVAELAATPDGARNGRLNDAAFNLGQLVGGGALDERTVIDELYRAMVANGYLDSDGERKTMATIRSGLEAGKREPRTAPEPKRKPRPEPALQPQPADDPFARSVSFAELDRRTFPTPSYLVSRVLPRGGITLLAGPPKMGKSYLALGLALAVAGNTEALGRLNVTEPGDVLFISLDDQSPARAQQRARQIYGRTLPAGAVLHVEPNLGRGEAARDAIGRYWQRHPDTKLVVVDTLTHLRGDRASTESVYDADVRFMALLRTLLDGNQRTILCLTHIRKEKSDDSVMSVSGTYGVTGGADSLIALVGNRLAPGRAIEVVSRDDAGCELALRFTDHGLVVTDDDPHDPALFLVPDDAAIYRALQESAEGLTASDLAQMVGGLSGGTKIGDRLNRMAKHGVIRRQGRGRYVAL